jgi:hypothetical protein
MWVCLFQTSPRPPLMWLSAEVGAFLRPSQLPGGELQCYGGVAPSSPIFKLGALGPHRCKWPNGVEGFRLSQTPWAGKVA